MKLYKVLHETKTPSGIRFSQVIASDQSDTAALYLAQNYENVWPGDRLWVEDAHGWRPYERLVAAVKLADTDEKTS